MNQCDNTQHDMLIKLRKKFEKIHTTNFRVFIKHNMGPIHIFVLFKLSIKQLIYEIINVFFVILLRCAIISKTVKMGQMKRIAQENPANVLMANLGK